MFVELNAISNFTFLTGGAHPEEYIDRAGLMGMTGLALADENSVAGIVRAHVAAREVARSVRLRAEHEAAHGPVAPFQQVIQAQQASALFRPAPPGGGCRGC